MTSSPDLDALARQYVELWQDQFAEAVVDPELTETLLRLTQLASGGLAVSTALWQNLWASIAAGRAAPVDGSGAGEPRGHDGSVRYPTFWINPAPGSAPAARASPGGEHDLVQLHARLAAVEERLAALETGDRRAGSVAGERPRRNDAP